MVAPLWVNRDYFSFRVLAASPLNMLNFVAIVEKNAGDNRDRKFVLNPPPKHMPGYVSADNVV